MAGTIFAKSTTSLQLWFYALYLVGSTRCGISAKQLERELGVTYKTAHRMMKRIRTIARKDLRMAFGGMGLVILAALIATLLFLIDR
jgi:transposase